MKKFLFALLALAAPAAVWAAGQQASITSTPSPAVSNKPLEIKIQTSDLGADVYCYTWCHEMQGGEKAPYGWDDVNTDKFKMSRSGNVYTYTISNIKEFYGLSDAQLVSLTKLGFIAKTSNGNQTEDCFVEVVQGPTSLYSGGEGTTSSPYIIAKSEDLQYLADTPADWGNGVCFKLDADINASTLKSTIGTMATPFSGTFDGNGHCITSLSLNGSTVGSATGLFGKIEGADIHDLGIAGANVKGATFTGILVGYASSGTVSRCYTMGTVSGSSICVGGLVGENVAATITDCYSGASVSNPSDYATGGLVGKNSGTIKNTYAAGAITGYDYVGGVAGANYGVVSYSLAVNETVSSAHNYAARFGGNANARNNSLNNVSWKDIDNASASWTQHGDHAVSHTAADIVDATCFNDMLKWDFNSIWEWQYDGKRNWPALRNVSGQSRPICDRLYESLSGVVRVIDNIMVSVTPNPTYGQVNVYAGEGILSCSVWTLDGGNVLDVNIGGEESARLDLSQAAPGICLLRVTTLSGNVSIFKILKK